MALRHALIALGLAATALTACFGSSGLTAPSGDSPLRLVALAPAAGESLSRGTTVTVDLTVIAGAAGALTLAVRDQPRGVLLASPPVIDLVPEQESRIHASFEVPAAASSIDLEASFRPASAGAIPVVIQAKYSAR